MSRKKIGGIIMTVMLCIAAVISIGVVATGEETTTMSISDEMLAVLKKLEGFSPTAYWDYQQYSIGYGSKCPDKKYYPVSDGGQGLEITEEYAEELLKNELEYFESELNGFINHFDLTLTQNQYDALVSFSYNVGATWMRDTKTWQYKSTGNLNSAIISGNTGSNFIYSLMLWSMAGKPERHILINRRIVETNVYANGVYSEDPTNTSLAPSRYRIAFMDANGGKVNYDEHGFDAEDPVAIKTVLTSSPVGPDETGVQVTYEFDGWYTERVGGTKVETLDSSIATGTVLYAHWKTPGGTPVTIPQTDTGMKVTVTLTGNNVNVRSGPETYYQSLYKAQKGDVFEIEEVKSRGGMLWGRSGDKWVALMYTDYNTVIAKTLPMWAKVTATTLNVRTGPGTGNALVENVQKVQGDLVRVTEWKTDETVMWGKIDEGWIALPYVTFENVIPPDKTVKSVEIRKNPDKLSYVHKAESLDPTGGQLLVTYEDDSRSIVNITSEMVSGFDNTNVGPNELTVTYGGMTATVNIQIVKAKVVFTMDDDSVISEKEYLYGDTVEIPRDPTRDVNGAYYYVFTGWDKEVSTSCNGSVTYKAVFAQKLIDGDCNGDGYVTDQDAIYLLRHVYFPDLYPIEQPTDYTKDGKTTDQDAIYLLRHVYFPDLYPLT